MIGAIAGDIAGSIYEARPIKTKDFPLFSPGCRFTDDSVLTVAIAEAILSGNSYEESVRSIGLRYPGAGYGTSFMRFFDRLIAVVTTYDQSSCSQYCMVL